MATNDTKIPSGNNSDEHGARTVGPNDDALSLSPSETMEPEHAHGTDHGHDAPHGSTHKATEEGGELFGILAEFRSPGELVHAARKVRDAGFSEFDCYSPFPVHGIDEAMGIKRTILPVLVTGGGLAGLVGGVFLQWWMNAYNWPWNIAGKPIWSIPANIPIIFECTILISVLTTFFGMWGLNKLPQVWHPFFRLDRFTKATDDGFMIGIEANDRRFNLEATTKLLLEAGALEVEPCYFDPDPAAKQMPKWLYGMIIASTAFALIPFAIIAKARASKSDAPHYIIFPDMVNQAKQKSDTATDVFADGRANRGEIPGTIARGSLNADDLYYRGLENHTDTSEPDADGKTTTTTTTAWTTSFPKQLEINNDLVERGQQRFDIYCTPCHGYDGRGMGAIPTRVQALGGAWQARNLVDGGGTPVQMPNGQLFNTISNGYNTMMGYSAQIPVRDRWAIVLYVRSLQRGQNALVTDAPEQLKDVR